MKALMFRDLNVEDRLRLFFKAALDPEPTPARELESFLRALEEYATPWMPDLVEGKRRRKYSRAAVWKALEEEHDAYGSIIDLRRTQAPAVSLTLALRSSRQPPVLDIGLDVQPLSFFAQAERCDALVDLVRAWASRYPVTQASAHSMADDQLSEAPEQGADAVHEISWLNVFGPRQVDSVGRERMLSTPAHRVEALSHGAILLVLWPTVADFASPEARQAQARALVHLRPDLDFDTVLRTLRERSATLAPVAPRFHPDVAPLLARAVDGVSLGERQRKIAGFNDWRPPEPEEWRPAETALASDVEDPERVLAHYGDLAERLVALLHSRVPSVFAATPESLTDTDVHFWSEDFPKAHPREVIDAQAVPAVGAYLGEMLVRNLGGRWIPRKTLAEAQVLVGNRVWLPFARARHYLRSRQSLLDCSLTQFYHVAERYRA